MYFYKTLKYLEKERNSDDQGIFTMGDVSIDGFKLKGNIEVLNWVLGDHFCNYCCEILIEIGETAVRDNY